MFPSQQVIRKVIITNESGKYMLTDELQNNVTLKKISKLHRVIVYYQFSSQNENTVSTSENY